MQSYGHRGWHTATLAGIKPLLLAYDQRQTAGLHHAPASAAGKSQYKGINWPNI